MVYFITRDVAVVTDLRCLAQGSSFGFRRASNGRRRTPASTDGISGEKETSGCRQVGRDQSCGLLSTKVAG